MSGFSINLLNAELVERLFTSAMPRIDAGLDQLVTDSTLEAEGAVISATPVGATGMLRQSMTHSISGSGGHIVGTVYSTDVPIKTISVELGRAPGRMPPIAPIQMWAARKAGDGSRSTAFLIARAIGRRGTKPARMFSRGFDAAQPRIRSRVDAFLSEIARWL